VFFSLQIKALQGKKSAQLSYARKMGLMGTITRATRVDKA